MITADDIQTRFPEFADMSDTILDACITEAALVVKETGWGDLYDTGLLYFAAHLALPSLSTAPGSGGASGPVTSKKVGEVTITYASSSSNSSYSAEDLTTSTYGRRFLYFQRIAQGGPVTCYVTAPEAIT